ncbi:OLC1v1016027C1 [Oldenlandia corymbosa var. corymbosa]|uniref:OLC1v1016027C1 n=1 Tax=Oldenlandia corymbosa var. corymbosa TaxID=529605 RepID=A0AAV1E5J5_OLDCO|nr:OLC1v1016027C1 [Oldenlandia corymbosa var. corymbosa]
MYGNDEKTPWKLFSPDLPWQVPVDPLGKPNLNVQVLYVFTKLKNIGKTARSNNKMKNRVAGCGIWHGNTTKEPVSGCDGAVIGYKSSFTFRTSSKQATIGQWNMIEYSLDLSGQGISLDFEDYPGGSNFLSATIRELGDPTMGEDIWNINITDGVDELLHQLLGDSTSENQNFQQQWTATTDVEKGQTNLMAGDHTVVQEEGDLEDFAASLEIDLDS